MKLEPSMVKGQLDRMNALQRATASFCHVLLSIEGWISPDGKARAWMKANTRFTVFMAAPTFMAFPVVTVALWELGAWVGALTTIASKLVFLPILLLLAFVSITVASRIIRALRP